MTKTLKAYYFPHDSNAIQDPKMMALLFECGLMGIGLFWIIIEILHQQECNGIAESQLDHYINFYGKQGEWSDALLAKCKDALFSTKLLFLKDGIVYSERVLFNMKRRHELMNIAKVKALKRWSHAAAMPRQCYSNATAMLRKERKGKETTTTTSSSTDVDSLFASFWTTYPKKIGKGAAEKAWKKIPDVKAVFETIAGAVAVQAKSEQWLKDGGQFIPHPATWLNQRRWEDEVGAREKVVG